MTTTLLPEFNWMTEAWRPANWRYDSPYRPELRRIISVDGEGADEDGRHAYTLLAAADDHGFRAYVAHDGSHREATDDQAANYGLTTVACLQFLISLPRDLSDLIVSFSFTYDITKILADLPFTQQLEISMYNVTTWGRYTLECLPRKYFKITDHYLNKTVKVWDVFSFWQSSFVKVLNGALNLFTDEQREIIKYVTEMKALRDSAFTGKTEAEIREYCFNECEFLSILYRDLLVNCERMGLKPKMHSGPGALASTFFTVVDIKRYMPAPSMDGHTYAGGMPRYIPMHSYYGGRFETAVLGDVGDVIQYDIHSAYPAIAVDLPCLSCGTFRQVKHLAPNKWGFYYVESDTDGPWAPFPFRCDSVTGKAYLNGATKGSIAFVHGGRRWVTAAEVEVATRFYGAGRIRILDGWVYEPLCSDKPFGALAELYQRRKDPKYRTPDGLKKIIKLLINSVYGKTAQSIGGRNGKPPLFQCYPWAAWMTGGTRAKVLEAALWGGESVVAIATDGILSTREIPELNVTDWQLGTWERTDKKDCWLGMPGIYSFGDGESAEFKRRGLDARYFPASHLRAEFKKGEWFVNPVAVARGFMPMRLAVRRTNWIECVGQWTEQPKTVNLMNVNHKRDLPAGILGMHDGSPIQLETIALSLDERSLPYAPKVSYSDSYDELNDPDMCIWNDSDLVVEDDWLSDDEYDQLFD